MKREGKKAQTGHAVKPPSTKGTGTGKNIESLPLSYSLSAHEGARNTYTLTVSIHWLRAVQGT